MPEIVCGECDSATQQMTGSSVIMFTDDEATARAHGIGGFCHSCGVGWCARHIVLTPFLDDPASASALARERTPLVATCPKCGGLLASPDVKPHCHGVNSAVRDQPITRQRSPTQPTDQTPADREERHRQALETVNRRLKDGLPFLLYLRDFEGGDRSAVIKSPYYLPENRFAVDVALRAMLGPDVGVVFVQSEEEEKRQSEHASGLGAQGPSLSLPDDGWQAYVSELIDLADVIIVDAPTLSEGTRFELKTCFTSGAADRTLVILSPPAYRAGEVHPHEPGDDDPDVLVQQFARVHWADDLSFGDNDPNRSLGNDFLLADLIDRARSISALAPERRKAARDELPITYAGVLDGYILRTNIRLKTRVRESPDPWMNNWTRTFWSLHRITLVLNILMTGSAISLREVKLLIGCYGTMCDLLGETAPADQTTTRGDLVLCEMLALLAVDLAGRVDDPSMLDDATTRLKVVRATYANVKADHRQNDSILKELFVARLGQVLSAT